MLFHSVQGALGAEKVLAAAGIKYKLIPVPRQLSSDCGFCIRFVWVDRERVEGLLLNSKFGVDKITALK